MRPTLICSLLMIAAVTIELAFHASVPSGALLIPLAAIAAFRLRGAKAVLTASTPGLLLLVLRPVPMSLLVLVAPAIVAMVSESLAREFENGWRGERTPLWNAAVFRAPWLAVVLMLAHHLPLVISRYAQSH